MKKFIIAICVCLTMLALASSAFAEELTDFYQRGQDEGLGSGALPPPGLYFINDFCWGGDWKDYNNGGEAIPGQKTNEYVDIPILLWNPGICPIFGATYACAISQTFDWTMQRYQPTPDSGLSVTGTQWGVYNTIIVPFILSWQLPENFYLATSFLIGLDDGTTSPADSFASLPASGHLYQYRLFSKNLANIYGWSSSNSYQFTPEIGLSWLYAGWNLSAEFLYTFWTKDNACEIQNGPELASDYTLTYTWQRWTFGGGATALFQTSNDKGYMEGPGGIPFYGEVPQTCDVNIAAGPIIGYNFGPCSLLFTYNFMVTVKNEAGGDFAVMRLVVPLGDPTEWWK